MITPTRVLIGILAVAVVGLAIAFGVALATDDDGSSDHMMSQGEGFVGMMSAMSGADSDAMLTHMKGVLGDDGYTRMEQHFRDHQSGVSMSGMTDIDQMMHTMMDGMMAEMPADSNDILPVGDPHHRTPAVASTPTPSR